MNRRSFLLALTSLAGFRLSDRSALGAAGRPLVGAIRWDVWYAPGTQSTAAVEKTLSPRQYHRRAPFFARIEENAVALATASQELIDLEIQQAAYAGLDYWAFFAVDESMSRPLDLYLSSRHRNRMRFCMFSGLYSWGRASLMSPTFNRHLSLMSDPHYVRVSGGRPLYFLGFITSALVKERWGDYSAVRDQIAFFRMKSIEQGSGDPYIVLSGPSAEIGAWSTLGGDAVGAYAFGHDGTGPYRALADFTRVGWIRLLDSKLPVVPTAMAGWDRRPRVENPVPWERYQQPGVGLQHHFNEPTPDELAFHLREAIDFVGRQPSGRQAPTVLIYAWNEFDEGGWVAPTLPCDTRRLEAIRSVLGSFLDDNPRCALPTKAP